VLLALFLILLTAAPVQSQNPQEITLTLRTKDGRTIFSVGEPIVVQLSFRASRVKKYELHEDAIRWRMFYASPTRFISEPSANTVDPLGDYPYDGLGYAFGSAAPRIWPLRARPVTIENYLNDWVAFRKPGRYRISAENQSVTLRGQRPYRLYDAIRVRSNTIDIEIREPVPGWADEQMLAIVPAIERRGSAFVSIKSSEPGKPATVIAARDALRFLATEEAARQLLRFAHVGQQTAWPALFASPHRSLIIQFMEGMLAAPEFAVSDDFLGHLLWLNAGTAVGPRRVSTPLRPERDYFARLLYATTATKARYVAELTSSLGGKRGNARDWAVRTIQAFNRPPVVR
jgi:hypothetical protein